MGKDLFKNLPSEIINDILLRLPVRAIAASKCVCRSWLDLLQTDEFVNSHHSRSTEICLDVLMMNKYESSRCSVYELEEEIDAHDGRHHNHLTTFDFPHGVAVLGSANGLLLLLLDEIYTGALYVCNPISREYIELNCPIGFFEKQCIDYWGYLGVNYEFGVSNVSGQYKVVRIMDFDNHCHVYTLGTGSWRRVDITWSAYGYLNYRNSAAVINGNLHWLLVQDLDGTMTLISCFDLETERFSTFSHPPLVVGSSRRTIASVFTLRDCLCWCDQTFGTFDIWLMKEYGVEKSWTKEYVINFNPDFHRYKFKRVRPIKVFKNGDILIQWGHDLLFYYFNKMKNNQQFGGPDDIIYTHTSAVLFTPSFLSLTSFRMENVFS